MLEVISQGLRAIVANGQPRSHDAARWVQLVLLWILVKKDLDIVIPLQKRFALQLGGVTQNPSLV